MDITPLEAERLDEMTEKIIDDLYDPEGPHHWSANLTTRQVRLTLETAAKLGMLKDEREAALVADMATAVHDRLGGSFPLHTSTLGQIQLTLDAASELGLLKSEAAS